MTLITALNLTFASLAKALSFYRFLNMVENKFFEFQTTISTIFQIWPKAILSIPTVSAKALKMCSSAGILNFGSNCDFENGPKTSGSAASITETITFAKPAAEQGLPDEG